MFKNDYLATKPLVERDSQLLWHPYAPLNAHPMYAVTHAKESTLVLEDRNGRTYRAIDAMSSWWSQVHGYRNPFLDEALATQTQKFSHVMFGGLTHEPAVELAEKLVALTPNGLNHVFLADSGSIAVEVSLKLAVQFQSAVGRPQRRGFLALRGG